MSNDCRNSLSKMSMKDNDNDDNNISGLDDNNEEQELEEEDEDTKEEKFVEVLDVKKDKLKFTEEVFKKQVPQLAKQFPFSLDVFQMQAIRHLERRHNVFVAAHTSAGKTVVADYAIAMAFRDQCRVIYTSPIKALSNQKYRDFKREFTDVGLLTGDVQINTESKCMIMTTEILLQMLYNSSEMVNELEYVIFDECHYVNDPERGHVWEEVFIMLPKHCKLVLLSATVPNVVQFADWLGRIRREKTYVVSTYERPVPLEHYLYVGRDGKSKHSRFMIIDGKGNFQKDNYKEAEQAMTDYKKRYGFIKRCQQTETNIYLNLIRHLHEKDKLPAIFFTLSRNRCDSNLDNLMAIKESFNLIDRKEESRIHGFIHKHLRRLPDCDQKLPQIQKCVQMLKKGLGVHHSGVLPLMKEMTEILFSDGLIKVLVATETFAMGVNMPARTVVFDSIEKHDGTQRRDLLSSEYIQMAGRAGRRGKDDSGTVIILCKYDIPDSPILTNLIQGSATKLVSKFRLTYHMICNQHKSSADSGGKDGEDETGDEGIEKFLERSFGEHNRHKQSNDLNQQLDSLRKQFDDQLATIDRCDQCSDIEVFYQCYDNYVESLQTIMPTICQKALEKGRLTSGRVVAIDSVTANAPTATATNGRPKNPFDYAVVLMANKSKTNSLVSTLKVLSLAGDDSFEYKTIDVGSVHKILNKQIKAKSIDVRAIVDENENSRNKYKSKDETLMVIEKLRQLSLPDNYQILNVESIDPKTNLQIKDIDSVEKINRYLDLSNKLVTFECIKCPTFVKHFDSIVNKMTLRKQMDEIDYKLSSESLQFLPEYGTRLKVLESLDYINQYHRLELKGKMACLMSEHELVICEMLTRNVLGNASHESDLNHQEIAALMSGFVYQSNAVADDDKIAEDFKWSPKLREKYNEIKAIECMIRLRERDFQVPDQAINSELNFGLVKVIYEWANGKSFINVMEECVVQEGIIVRCIQRLDELLKFVKLAAKMMGNDILEKLIEESSKSIRRDIVFFPSLYTSDDNNDNDNNNDEDNVVIDANNENLSFNFV
ncbi:SKI2 subunit of superkiller complex protein-like [Oppia nitens]|uniref:SKI2 subunit of superkiller complex protein-like n=1 Tax=Oppia nitens TaxID=1686743 RepID=UPI0023DCBE66|nr:SKI2 subunit of superkiller complex protein-like [Oppia nitens]